MFVQNVLMTYFTLYALFRTFLLNYIVHFFKSICVSYQRLTGGYKYLSNVKINLHFVVFQTFSLSLFYYFKRNILYTLRNLIYRVRIP